MYQLKNTKFKSSATKQTMLRLCQQRNNNTNINSIVVKKHHYSGCVDSSIVVIVVFASDKDTLLSAVLACFAFWLSHTITHGPNRHTRTAKALSWIPNNIKAGLKWTSVVVNVMMNTNHIRTTKNVENPTHLDSLKFLRELNCQDCWCITCSY